MMNAIQQRVSNLSPEKRRLFEQLLSQESNKAWSRAPYEAPRNDVERRLLEIWSNVLGVGAIGIHDNYFELGGDSIQCIQIMSHARRAGIRITTGLLFENPTVAQLAAIATFSQSNYAETLDPAGPAPLTPVQRWYFNLNVPNVNHWNQAMLLETVPGVSAAMIAEALQQVNDKHGALRLRFHHTENGWEQAIAAEESVALHVSTISETDDRNLSEFIQDVADRTQRSLDIGNGPVLAAAFFDRDSKPGRLLLTCHHLVADAVSFRIIAEDLETILRSLTNPETPFPLMENTTSWRHWCHTQFDYARSEEIEREREYWTSDAGEPDSLPVDYSDGTNLEKDSQTHSVALSAEDTTAFFRNAIASLRADATEILLTAMVHALNNWTGKNSVTIDLEGHGREHFDETIDLSRTVGWFTTIYPVRISGQLDNWRSTLRSVKETLATVPRRGYGYGLQRYLLEDQALVKRRSPIAMNYLGRFDHVLPEGSLLLPTSEDYGQLYDPAAERPYVLQVVSLVLHGRLQTNWIYSDQLHSRATIESLAAHYLKTLRSLIAAAETSGNDLLTPADFPDAELSPLELERILKG